MAAAETWRRDVAEKGIQWMASEATREQARELERSGAGKRSMDGIRVLLKDIKAGEEALLAARSKTLDDSLGAIGLAIDEMSTFSTAIAVAVEEQGTATQEIARSVQEAAKGTQEVTSHIHGVAKASGETGTAATHMQTSASSLALEADKLKAEVQGFLSNVRAA